MALREALQQGEKTMARKPPHLGLATGPQTCSTCRYFKRGGLAGPGACRKYGGYPVKPGEVCDSWAKG